MKIVFYIFLALVVLAPLPFGMVYDVFQAVFACGFLGLVVAYCGIRGINGDGPAVGLGRIWPECVGFGVVLVWAVFQVTPLGLEVWHHPLWMEVSDVLGKSVKGSLSLARGEGFASIMRLIMYAGVFWLAFQLGKDRHRARLILGAVVAAVTVYAAYGLVMHLGGYGLVLWVEVSGGKSNVTGPFINRNNFAAYTGLGLLCAAGFYLAMFFKAIESRRIGRDKKLYVFQKMFVQGAPLLACTLIMLTALFLSNSRGGVVCALSALLVLGVFMGLLGRMHSRFSQWATGSLLVVVIGVFFFSGEGWLDRLTATELERETRLIRYEQVWEAIELSPVAGYGLGSFEGTFQMFADERTVNSVMAHNDWLEIMFELGLPVAFVWFAVLGGLGLRCLIGFFRRRRDHVYPLVGLCACLLVGLHALVDFTLQIPAVAVTYAVLVGVGVGQSR